MPTIAALPRISDTNTQTEYVKDTVHHSMSTSAVWIVAAVVGGIIVVGFSFALLLTYNTRRRRYRRYRQLHPYLSRDEVVKRQKMSKVDLFLEEEERRRQMIRKSLAARSSESCGSTSLSAMIEHVDGEQRELERQESTRLKEDWKRWEARVRHERSMSGGQHPVASASSQVPVLAVPSPAKHRRASSMSPTPSPPVPPRHPGRRSAT
ncbi:hypothetical protein N658DRAFT_505139 [Parathielavia hyrcaniae]|uniref:Uncharacterized protein n=1 Tax=Parathielavia hyrcaniae TaxID=113614 RepID=A0AAN6T463_9PEZI|nr:hypothetical protein N658DRAFT_505139 [Parathielavia hyrcaniae]